jgi:glycosyltransferase involved in cell wall biosynthesis
MKVSACIITYNQEDYIVQCLEGALSQIVDFEYEIVIGEDKSTDRTLEICKFYADKYPDKIRLIHREKNLGVIGNWTKTLKECSGDYLALCEGDDYWTDPLKLQKQVDFLEQNKEYIACQHNRELLYNDGTFKFEKSEVGIFTQCFVFRNLMKGQDYKPDKSILNGDTFLEYFLKLHGKIKSLDFTGAVYRITGFGVFTSLDDVNKSKNSISTLKQILKVQKQHKLDNKNEDIKIIQSKLTECQFFILASGSFKLKQFAKYLYFMLKYNRLGYKIEYKRLLYLVVRKRYQM